MPDDQNLRDIVIECWLSDLFKEQHGDRYLCILFNPHETEDPCCPYLMDEEHNGLHYCDKPVKDIDLFEQI